MRISYRTVMLLAYYGDPEAKAFVTRWKMRKPSELWWEWSSDTYQDNPLGILMVSNMPQTKER